MWNSFVLLEKNLSNDFKASTFGFAGVFLLGPSIYFYIVSHIHIKDLSWSRVLPHYSLFFLSFILITLNAWNYVILKHWFFKVSMLLIFAQVIVYCFLSVKLLLAISIQAKQEWADKFQVVIRLMGILVGGFGLMIFVDFIFTLLNWFGILSGGYAHPVMLIDALLILTFAAYSQKHQSVFQRFYLHGTVAVKYKTSNLTKNASMILSKQLSDLMEKEKPYLDNDLSLTALAALLEVSPHVLSQLLNEKLQQSFYDYINTARVEEVSRVFVKIEFAHLSIIDIAYQSGFNNRSSFNNAFKKHFRLPPGRYRKQILAK